MPLLAAALLAAGLASAAVPDTGPLVSATQVGPLRFGQATAAQVQAWAGRPQHVWRFKGNGQLPGNGLFLSRAEAYGYGCTEPVDLHGCRTVYALKAGRLIGFWTRGTTFHTAAGIHVGTSLTRALVLEKLGRWAGFSVQCPAIVLSASSTEFKADVTRTPPRVSDFLISLAPQSFADGC